MRWLSFLLLGALVAVPCLTGCVGIANPQTEWTTTDGVGGDPPVSSIERPLDVDDVLAVADVLTASAGVLRHVEGEADARPRASTRVHARHGAKR